MTPTPQEFVHKWRQAALKERSAYQEHFTDVCRLVGHATPVEFDPVGDTFTFEAGADKVAGGHGWADVWYRGHFAWEYKGKDADLDRAYQQLLQYRESLQNPPLLIVSDLDQIVIHTNFTNTVKRVYRLALDDLLVPDRLEELRAAFYNPEALRARQTTAEVTAEAAAEFARLSDHLRRWGAEPQAAAHFLIRLLFVLFAEDVELLPGRVFTRLVEAGRRNPRIFNAQLRRLFGAMAEGGAFGVDLIAHFDGGLFDDDQALELDSEALDVLAKVTNLDWANIEPSIFGTLFVRSLDPAKRAQLGAQYTSKDDILLIVEPVLMRPLRQRWAKVRAEAEALAAKRAAAPAGARRDRVHRELSALLTGFSQELANVRVLDPACGSGNFLYVSLRCLLDLEKEVVNLAGDLGVGRFFPAVSPAQLLGIEIDPYAHELAQTTVWIGYIQWLRENGFGTPSEPILRRQDTIKQMDAILAYDEQGRPVEPEWPEADVIMGNPPFLGGSRVRSELGDKYAEAMFKLYGDRIPNLSDLVCYWFEKARAMIAGGRAKRAGLLATQAIRAGASRKVLERIKHSGDIFWAQSDREWTLEGAAVRVSMVGFDGGVEQERWLDGRLVERINPNLSGSVDVTQARRLTENFGICFQGPSPKAPFDIDAATAKRLLTAPNNVNGRPNSDVVRPVVNAGDLVQRFRNAWTIDFGLMPYDQAAQFEMPFEYVKRNVLPVRSQRRADFRGQWWQYARPRPEMRAALLSLQRYIATPRVAKHRVFVWLPAQVLANDRTFVFASQDDYDFGTLHSRLHQVWALATSSRHGVGNDPTYNNTTCFETFPFPWPPGREPTDDPRVQAIAEAARELVQLRDNWLNPPGASEAELKKRTLTNLYNQRPAWLDNAHRKLDQAVFAAYGWPADLSDDEILARLLALNLERAAGQGGAGEAAEDDEEAEN